MNTLTIVISIFSTIIAVFAIWISTRTLNEQKRISQITSNYSLLAQTSSLIVEHPNLLELHNISQDELKQIGVTEKEVVYMMQIIFAGEIYYEIENPRKVDCREFSDYRQNFLKNPKVRAAWIKFIREKMVFVSPFVLAIDDFYKNLKTDNNAE